MAFRLPFGTLCAKMNNYSKKVRWQSTTFPGALSIGLFIKNAYLHILFNKKTMSFAVLLGFISFCFTHFTHFDA
jgi:hypothetical protein